MYEYYKALKYVKYPDLNNFIIEGLNIVKNLNKVTNGNEVFYYVCCLGGRPLKGIAEEKKDQALIMAAAGLGGIREAKKIVNRKKRAIKRMK